MATPILEQDIRAILAESDPARRRLLAARAIEGGQQVGMTSNQARQVIDTLARRDAIPYAQAASDIRDAYSSLMQQTPVQAGPRTMDRAAIAGSASDRSLAMAEARGGGQVVPPYYAGPPEGQEAFQQRFYQSVGADPTGNIERQGGGLASLVGGGGQAWYTDPVGTAKAVGAGLGIEPGASIGFNLSAAMGGDPRWQSPEQASENAMRTRMALEPLRDLRRAQSENMAGSIAGTIGGYAGAAGAGGRAGLRATAGLGRGGARMAARVAGGVAGENVGIGLQAGVLEAGRTADAGEGAQAGWRATTLGIAASVATKLARGEPVAPMEWADLGMSLGFDGVSAFQTLRALNVPEPVARQAAEHIQILDPNRLLPPGRNAQELRDATTVRRPVEGEPGQMQRVPREPQYPQGADPQGIGLAQRERPVFTAEPGGQVRVDPAIEARPRDETGRTPGIRQADEFSEAQRLRQVDEAAQWAEMEAQAGRAGDDLRRALEGHAREADPFYGVTIRAYRAADDIMRQVGPARHKERLAVTRLALREQFPELGEGSLNRITRQTARKMDAEAMEYGQGATTRPMEQTPGQQFSAQAAQGVEVGPVREAMPRAGEGAQAGVNPRQSAQTLATQAAPAYEPYVGPQTIGKYAPKPGQGLGERLEIPGSRTPEASTLTRADVESRLVERATERGYLEGNEGFASRFTDEAEVDTKFRGNMPTELKEALEGRPHLRTMIRTRVDKGTGEDSLASLGTDRFVELLEAQQGNKARLATEALEGDPDPEISWLLHAREAVGPGERLTEIPASSLAEGSTFRIGEQRYTVARRDGILTAIDEQGGAREISDYQSVPISKGSLREGSPRAAQQALKRAEEFDAAPVPFGDDATPPRQPDLTQRTVRATRADMESAGFEKVAEMGSQNAAVAYAKRQEKDGGPQHIVIKDGGKHLVLKGSALSTVLVAMGLGAVAKGIADAETPEEAEAAYQAGFGDMDMSNPMAWLLVGAAAYIGVGTVAKRANVRVPGGQGAANVAARAGNLPREALSYYSGPLIDRLAKQGKGKPETTGFVEAARAAADESKLHQRRWAAEIIDPVAKRMHGAASVLAGRRSRAELQHLEHVAEVDGIEVFESRAQRLVEGLEPEDGFGKVSKQYLQTYRRLYKETGKHMEDAGLEIEVVGADGKPEVVPFKQQGEPKWVRNVSADLVRAMVEGGDYGNEVNNAVAKAITALNKSPEAAGEWKRIANAIKSAYDGSDVSTAKIIRTINAEHLRTIERMPAAITFTFGGQKRTIHLLDTDPIRQLNHMANKAASRAAVARHIGYERSTRYGREKSIAEMRQAVASETGGLGGDLFDETMRSLSGLPLAQHMRYRASPGTSAYGAQRAFGAAFNLARQAQLSASFVVNMPEPAAHPRVLMGNRNFARAILDLTFHPRRTVDELRREGGATRDNAPWWGLTRPMTPHDLSGNILTVWESIAHSASRAVGTLHRASNSWGEMVSAAGGKHFIEQLREGKGTVYHGVRLRLLNFNDAQITKLLSGEADDALYSAIQTRFAQMAVGSDSMPHELSKVGNSNLARAVLWHDSYTQMITNRTGKILSTMLDPSVPKAERAAAAVLAADLGISGGMVGLTGIMLRAMVYGGLPGLAMTWGATSQQLSGEEGVAGVRRALLHVYEAYFGGPLYAAMGGMLDEGVNATELARMSGAVTAGMDFWNLASGSGRYAHLPTHEQIDLYLRSSTPVYRGTSDWIAAYALGDDNPAYNRAKGEVYRYLRDNDLMSVGEFGQAEAFTVGMRRAKRFIMAGDYEKAREAMIDAAQEDGKSWNQVRQSLLGMRVLPRIPVKDRAKHLQAIRARLGDNGYARVLMHDRLLEAMAR